MNNIVVISGHPDLNKSTTNKTILETLDKAGNDRSLNISIRYLDKLYPNSYDVDIESEQAEMLKADIIVLQFPLYWYSVPAILKNWLDKVFTFGFAFGPEGSKLEGKKLLISTTIGSSEDNYVESDDKNIDKSIEAFLKPLMALGKYSSMEVLPAIYSFDMSYIPEIHRSKDEVVKNAIRHGQLVIEKLEC